MDQKILSINNGSASKKYALYEGEKEVFRAHLEKEKEGLIVTLGSPDQQKTLPLSQKDYVQALSFVLGQIEGEVNAVGLRVVAPGSFFQENRKLDSGYLAKLQEAQAEAPLHITPVIEEIEQLRKLLPDTPIMTISDSAFHGSLPETARRYSLPKETAEKFDIYRYGYHGISMSSVLRKFKEQSMAFPGKIIICHLGSGSTITAVKDGKSFDTSMGFTPLEGLVMGTRIGTIDAGAVLYLAKKSGMKPLELEEFFNKKCGLLG
ncbi:MAG: Acetate kinase, partial [candidate division CPR1 bacterium GW2011_GWC1_49_13]